MRPNDFENMFSSEFYWIFMDFNLVKLIHPVGTQKTSEKCGIIKRFWLSSISATSLFNLENLVVCITLV